MCKKEYKFRLDLENETISVFPIYEEKVLSSVRTGTNKYLIASIDAKFTFLEGVDFTFIMGEDVEHEFTLRIDRVINGIVQENWKTGTFTRLDFEVFDDKQERRIEVSMELDDIQKKIEEKENEDFNFFDLNVTAREVKYDVPPIFQIYNSANGKISNHVRGNYWEEFAEVPTRDESILTVFGFERIHTEDLLRFGMGFGEPNINGNYPLGNGSAFENENGLYRIEFTLVVVNNQQGYTGELIRQSDNEVLFEYNGEGLGVELDFAEFIHVDGADVGLFRFQGVRLYSRVLVAVNSVAGQTVIPIPADDISTPKANYSHIIEGNWVFVYTATEIQEAKTPYLVSGIPTGTNENRYFTELVSPPNYSPVLKSSWIGGAVFMSYTATGIGFYTSALRTVKNSYCYELVDVVRAMMINMVDGVTVGNSLGHFFDIAINPITNTQWSRIFLTHKSNVKTINFESPATKANIKYADIKNLMEFGFNCFPYLKESELKFEHELFFRNGKNYIEEIIGTDLTEILEAKNNLRWAFNTSTWKYAKEEIPSEIKTKWSEGGSTLFDGQPIKLLSKYATKGNPKENTIAQFITDLEFAMSNPDSISSEGFVLLFVDELPDGTLKVNYQNVDLNGVTNIVQNGKGAITYLHDKFHRDGLPSKQVEINGEEVEANSVRKTRIQELTFGGGEDSDLMELVKSDLGNGEVEKWDENLEDGSVKATLRHNI